MKAELSKRLYYMHPINTYGTKLERQQLAYIASCFFPEWDIINPNQEEHREGYTEMQEKTSYGMLYFINLAGTCHGGIALPFRDGKFGAGVVKEIITILDNDGLVWEIDCDCLMSPLWENSIIDVSRILSVKETKKRVYIGNSKRLQPY